MTSASVFKSDKSVQSLCTMDYKPLDFVEILSNRKVSRFQKTINGISLLLLSTNSTLIGEKSDRRLSRQ